MLAPNTLQIVGPSFTPRTEAGKALFEKSSRLEFVGLSQVTGTTPALAAPHLLATMVAELRPSEKVIAHIDFATPKASGLAIEIIAAATSRHDAAERSKMLTSLFSAALKAGLPPFELQQPKHRPAKSRMNCRRTLSPAGATLPLGTNAEPPRPRGCTSPANPAIPVLSTSDDAPACHAVVFSPAANGEHLASLGIVLHSIPTDVALEVHMSHEPFNSKLLSQVATVRSSITDRITHDASGYVRDQRYVEASKHFEDLTVAGSGVRFEVVVRSKRPLHDCEASAISAALFGTPDKHNQPGHLASLRSIYPQHTAVTSFLGIMAAASIPALERRAFDQLDDLDGIIIGKEAKSKRLVRMAVKTPRSHAYISGRSGTGKSALLHNLIQQEIEADETIILIDPHGDLWANIRDTIPAARQKDLLLIHMADPLLQPKMNLLDIGPGDPAEARSRLVDSMVQHVRRLMFSGLTTDATGPMFNKYFRAMLMLVLEAEGANAKLEMMETVFADEDYRDELRSRSTVSKQTKEQMDQITRVRGNDHTIEDVTPWVTSKLSMLTQSAILRPIIGCAETSFTFDDVLANNKICLINLASGQIGPEAATLLGGILTQRIEQAAKRQSSIALENRKLASIYFDEFHTFASEYLRPLMAESRKYGLRVTLANQTLSQLRTNDIKDGVLREVLGNCANTICFGVDLEDASYIAPRFGSRIDPRDLVSQPNYQAVCQFQTKTGSMGPFVIKTLPPPIKTP